MEFKSSGFVSFTNFHLSYRLPYPHLFDMNTYLGTLPAELAQYIRMNHRSCPSMQTNLCTTPTGQC